MISVIIPVYNTEKYLQRCIDSVINQSYRNLEIILVDDGSTDSSPKICDEYVEQDIRIRVIHQKNKGLSGSRNAGIEIASGDFIAFIDSDDYIHPRMMEELLNAINKEHADIAVCGYHWLDEDSKVPDESISGVFETISDNCHFFILKCLDLAVIACNKLFRKSIFENIRFPEGRYHEDEFVAHYIFGKCQCITYTNDKLYYYMKHGESITGSLSVSRIMDKLDALEDRMNYYKNVGLGDLYGQSARLWIGVVLENYALLNGLEDRNVRVLLKKELRSKLSGRLPKFKMQHVIKPRYYNLCTIWAKAPVVGSALLKLYDYLHRLVHGH